VAPAENDVRTAPVPDKRVAEDSSLHFGGLRVEVALAKCACLLTHVDTMETARLEWERRRVVGTVDIIAVNAEWEIPEWKLHVSMPHGGDAAIILTLPTSRLELRILR
jgi:hypothetical protein